jgi:(E)-4-hydroxy-3-methylbut-2-enyl-diphosphate synthase
MPFKDIATSDSIFLPEVPKSNDAAGRRVIKRLQDVSVGVFAPYSELQANPLSNSVAVISLDELFKMGKLPVLPEGSIRYAIKLTGLESNSAYDVLPPNDAMIASLILEVPTKASRVHASRRVFQLLHDRKSTLPVVHSMVFSPKDKDELILRIGSEAGALLVDGLGDGVMVSASGIKLDVLRQTSFNLLQGCRMRSTKTDFVSCPSCGRTLFDLQEVTDQIKQATGHLPGVSIAIMGCIVNGPGEMADADFGYVGGAPGKVDLYVGKEVVRRAVPNEKACDALVQLIKDYGRQEKPVAEAATEVAIAHK